MNSIAQIDASPSVWNALVIWSGRERGAADHLKNANIQAYWPCYLKQVPDRIRLGFRRAQLFSVIPGYIFITGASDLWSIVNQTPGVATFLRDANKMAAKISQADIEIIRRIENGMNLPPDPKTAHKFKIGDKVRFTDDIFHRWPPGIVERLAEDGRVSVGTSVLGRIVPILAYPHQIESI